MLNGNKPTVKVGGDFEAVPFDKYTVLCVDVNMTKKTKFQSSELEDVLNYKFQILDDKPMPIKAGEEPATTRGRFVWHDIRLVMNENSWLGKLAKAVSGRALTKEEMETFDVESPVGHQVDVMIIQKESKGKMYNNIKEYSQTQKLLTVLEGSPEAGKHTVVNQSTVPVTAPVDEAEDLIGTLEKEGQEAGGTPAAPTAPVLSEEEELRQKLAAIEAKKKAEAVLAK